ncbi:hypothetical protein H6F42_15070 [Pseudanabaena sp. FACHB-1998]|uniref:hypothetical protein n=1 Tax=Pseudanabaena sp. FACHB-1998 TaxID=2692858 RepID=UPI00167FE531|nr:hypothetical protein [Pseudanabaena sp. FACHB-1998]MBD2178238.1 hypothetical protein [Pseudanabaena sp. FACHB-1998]
MGDRLLINGEEVIFKGWVDQSLTAIEVKAIVDDQATVKQVRAKDIKSLARSLGTDPAPQTVNPKTSTSEELRDASAPDHHQEHPQVSVNSDLEPEISNQDVVSTEHQGDTDEAEAVSPEDQTELTPEPEYNAWEVWMYLERQRLKTLKLLNTFQAEWEANRFVREAERSAPPTLRVHYEIRPIWLDESTLNSSDQNEQDSNHSANSQDDPAENYADAIDVEIIS